ncbi:DNAJ like protein, putative [Plasmodium knowlesi strain H]|uniref:DNAJ like protein, putative n=3 Tax=Plasmodium knowlesi TaxID=5850 RepID=A0A5K1UBC3_PLAKH|nr:DnaJ protein, putative [Plasmodium knowlesi strain H]OTN64796.1 putative DNAJ like protein [Plasmodium knowlesi]CAA9988977.1 DnaJ protein, putative [Plasmodium knowlesi strain H]SBO24821.1 DNAJ like protein, putative [Plasmodium knowlesi strain H]SBO28084.1 DNAJ like protein, putative [Plasmodium knowlesi strain H]VVS78451.1 DnaJ protein, putative [Plasmodium knowlesi strain H]|eukprot:XP_002261325.1 DnaJ-like protein, putative [Plasmodium knowlesi strain H]
MNYHKILGVTKNACKKTIREAYLKKVKLYHPDLNKSPDATSKFKQIQEAYQALYNNDYAQKSHYGESSYGKGNKAEDSKNNQSYSYSDDFTDFHKAFYEEVRKMRENERREQNRRYANSNYSYSLNDLFHKYPREHFYINLIFKLFPLFVVPFLFLFIVYKQYLLKSHFSDKPILIYDAYGRAFLIDSHGRKFRAAEFDKY